MAIVQASMAEEILSRSERAVIRGIYRASQLAEARMALEKTIAASSDSASKRTTSDPLTKHIDTLKAYLDQAISNALIATKVPAISQTVKDNPSPSA